MKKGKVFGKNQVIIALMVVALGGAVWLNMKFSSTEKYLGEATYVSDGSVGNGDAIQTSGKVEAAADYFEKAKQDRQKALESAQETAEETLKSAGATDVEREKALNSVAQFTARIEKAINAENLLKAKGFEKAVVIIGDSDVSVVIKAEGITTTQTLQIQDIITTHTQIPLSNIKIVTVK